MYSSDVDVISTCNLLHAHIHTLAHAHIHTHTHTRPRTYMYTLVCQRLTLCNFVSLGKQQPCIGKMVLCYVWLCMHVVYPMTHSGPQPSCLHTTCTVSLEIFSRQPYSQFPTRFTFISPSHRCDPPESWIWGNLHPGPAEASLPSIPISSLAAACGSSLKYINSVPADSSMYSIHILYLMCLTISPLINMLPRHNFTREVEVLFFV